MAKLRSDQLNDNRVNQAMCGTILDNNGRMPPMRNRKRRQPREFFTFGYQSHTANSMIGILKSNKVELVVDIRQNPVSRKAGFSKSRLQAELPKHGIEYLHFSPLGTPPSIRAIYRKTGNVDTALRKYASYLERKHESLQHLIDIVSSKRFCLLCFEKDHHLCHRGVVASKLAEMSRCRPIHLS